jgi:hypothetical protein
MPPCNGADRGCAARQHHPTRKGADFPRVSAGVNQQPTGVRKQSRYVGEVVTTFAGAASTTVSHRELALLQ